ncbi:MAG: hypothetical protein SGI88_18335 [Candidatus Hydrogenedentes bacterium]|nr:hypothetical protein [Candidatus Hydrogenedentota bacterium]
MNFQHKDRVATIAVMSIFVATLLFGFYRSQFGLSYTDEGYYLASPMRIALGDVPFRDEIVNPQRMFDIVFAPIFMMFPGVTVYQLRCANVVLEVFASFCLFMGLRRFVPAIPLAFACGLSVFMMNNSWSPNYHNTPVALAVLAWCCWLMAVRQEGKGRAALLAALSGAILFVAAVIYVPLLVVLVFGFAPVFVFRRGRTRLILISAVQSGTVACLVAVAVGIVVAFGLADDYLYATTAITSPTHYAFSLAQKLKIYWETIWPDLSVLVASAGAAYWFAATLGGKARAVVVIVAGTFAGAVLALVVLEPSSRYELQHSPFHARYLRVALMCLGLHCGVALRSAMQSARDDVDDWRVVYVSALALSLPLAFVYSFLSVGAFKIMYLVPVLYPLAVAAVWQCAGVRNGEHASRALALTLFAGLFACITYGLPWQYVMKEKYIAHQTAAFTAPGVAGIKTLPADARSLDALTTFLAGKVARGDFLLAYHHLPVVYYVTGTRPALDRSWSGADNPLWGAHNSLEYMLQERRVPRYCVRLARAGNTYSADPRIDPVNALVERHYQKIATVPYTELEPFCEVFELRADSPLQGMVRDAR